MAQPPEDVVLTHPLQKRDFNWDQCVVDFVTGWGVESCLINGLGGKIDVADHEYILDDPLQARRKLFPDE